MSRSEFVSVRERTVEERSSPRPSSRYSQPRASYSPPRSPPEMAYAPPAPSEASYATHRSASHDLVDNNFSMNLISENRQLRQDLRRSQKITKRLEKSLSQMSGELSEVIMDVHQVKTERDAFKSELHKLRRKVADLNVRNIKLEMQNKAVHGYIQVVKEDLDFYRTCYNRSLTADGKQPVPQREYDSPPGLSDAQDDDPPPLASSYSRVREYEKSKEAWS